MSDNCWQTKNTYAVQMQQASFKDQSLLLWGLDVARTFGSPPKLNDSKLNYRDPSTSPYPVPQYCLPFLTRCSEETWLEAQRTQTLGDFAAVTIVNQVMSGQMFMKEPASLLLCGAGGTSGISPMSGATWVCTPALPGLLWAWVLPGGEPPMPWGPEVSSGIWWFRSVASRARMKIGKWTYSSVLTLEPADLDAKCLLVSF